jgi:hypothetical protein
MRSALQDGVLDAPLLQRRHQFQQGRAQAPLPHRIPAQIVFDAGANALRKELAAANAEGQSKPGLVGLH